MKLHELRNEQRGTANFGCMWKKGEIPADSIGKAFFYCKTEGGEAIDLQSRITAIWPDGSIKWTAHCADSNVLGRSIEVFHKISDSIQQHEFIGLSETDDYYELEGKKFSVVIRKKSDHIFESVRSGDRLVFSLAKPVLKLEEPTKVNGCEARITRNYEGRIDKLTLEETGPVQTVFKYEGVHVCTDGDLTGEEKIPFVLRMFIGTAAGEIKFQHTFLYDGDENKDFLKGIGIEFESPVSGTLYNRHIKFLTDAGAFHEAVAALQAWRPRLPEKLYEDQLKGVKIDDERISAAVGKFADKSSEKYAEEEEKLRENISFVMDNCPRWDCYSLLQDSAMHYRIRKKLEYADVCYVDCLHGKRTVGSCSFGSEEGSVMIGIRDFWEKYPGGITVSGLAGDMAKAQVWFYSPEAESYDFRHYAHRGYNQVCYEGYDYKGAEPVGIACTSECAIGFDDRIIPDDKCLADFAEAVNHPTVYVAEPKDYHDMKAFGYWSLPSKNTEVEEWLEDQLGKAFSFYNEEVEQRGWYGLFDYGDFMHTYDGYRHQWKYDVGGYAWDNTELVPTLWLWNYFLRTGREDVFNLAEKLSRHASEVDVYHFGKYKGLGSRHNVRHWGCPCKEARIAMAAHHRVFYYLTGDRRLEDIFDELKDNENSFLNKDPLGDFYDKADMVYPSHARSGPDWSSLVSNWMTQWERMGDATYKNKIMVGIHDLEKAPLRLASGPDFEFDPATLHLRYLGERTTGGTHLQVCMGAPSVWMETADLIDYPYFKQLLAELGRFALLPREEQLLECENLIGEREYTYPFMFTALGAYAAALIKEGECEDIILGRDVIKKDHVKEGEMSARRTWKALLASLLSENDTEGFKTTLVENCGNRERLSEIPWITTNFTAQWCLNVIIALDFIRQDLPKTLKEAAELVKDKEDAFRKA